MMKVSEFAMKISEIMQSSPEAIFSRIGKGPYLYYGVDGELIIDCSLQRIFGYYVKDGKVLQDIDIYAYGFKKDESDTQQYVSADDLKRRFEGMEKEGFYEFIEPSECNGITLQVPSYCGYDELFYLVQKDRDMIVNCKPIEVAIQEEVDRRIKKSEELGR